MAEYVRDPAHWLFKFSPQQWIAAAMTEVRRADEAYKRKDARGGLAGCRRAAGMALNAAMIVEPNDAWGRSYVDHVAALERDTTAPDSVRESAKLLLTTQPPRPDIVFLRSAQQDTRLLEATRDIIAHSYAVVARHEAKTTKPN